MSFRALFFVCALVTTWCFYAENSVARPSECSDFEIGEMEPADFDDDSAEPEEEEEAESCGGEATGREFGRFYIVTNKTAREVTFYTTQADLKPEVSILVPAGATVHVWRKPGTTNLGIKRTENSKLSKGGKPVLYVFDIFTGNFFTGIPYEIVLRD